MIRTEHFFIGQQEFVRTFSDRGMLIHGGMPEGDYAEANDPAEFNRQYVETNIPIEGETDAEEIVNILTGESE